MYHSSNPYQRYAAIYDRTGQARFSLRMLGYCFELWALFGFKPSSVLDLACGTGSAAIAMARRGFSVTAVDRSPTMLEMAAAKAERWGASVHWLEQDVRLLDAGGPFDAATCFYDSLNYLLVPEELQTTFTRVREHLKPGGVFVADLITDYAIRVSWGDRLDTHVDDEVTRIWRGSYDPETRVGDLYCDFFVREGELYRRVSELHQHRGYAPDEVREIARVAGFEPLACYECLSYRPVSETTYRIAYILKAR